MSLRRPRVSLRSLGSGSAKAWTSPFRFVLLAPRQVFSDQPVERLREIYSLIRQTEDQNEGTRILYALLHNYLAASTVLDGQRVDGH
jgi:hypothetical protein